MRMAEFIRANLKPIANEWEAFARTLEPAASHATPLSLRDHIIPIMAFIAYDIESAQSDTAQIGKSHGEMPPNLTPSAAEIHASLRYAGGFDMDQMVSEYRALRASVVKLWLMARKTEDESDIIDLTRFHEAVDQVLTESIRNYTQKLDRSRGLFLGILGHDIRNPLGAISMSAQLMLKIGQYSERENMLLAQICDSTRRADEIVAHLLDLTRTRLGSGLPVLKEPANLGVIGKQIVSEMQAMHPDRIFQIKVSGELDGAWDKARLAQVLSNLLGNAVQYGFKSTPVCITIAGHTDDVVLSVQNEGQPIPEDVIDKIFDSLVRGEGDSTGNLGLGLYISQQIVLAHGGTLEATSSAKDGTCFTARFPR